MNVTLSFYEYRLSGRDTQTLTSVFEFIKTFCTQRQLEC